MSIESLYRLLRPYGRIFNMSMQASTSKDSAKYCVVEYAWLRSAVAARNCVHGCMKGNTRLMLSYEKIPGFFELVMKWVRDHPRIMVPVLLGLLAVATYLIFDPLRVWFIRNKITSRFSLTRMKGAFVRWLLGFTEGSSLSGLLFTKMNELGTLEERESEEKRLIASMKETPGDDNVPSYFDPKSIEIPFLALSTKIFVTLLGLLLITLITAIVTTNHY